MPSGLEGLWFICKFCKIQKKTLVSRVKAQNVSLKEKYDELDRLYEALVRKEKAWVPHFNYNLD